MVALSIGIHREISEAEYHADCSDGISASASILRTLYDASPEHAAWDHPKLNPKWKPTPSTDAQAVGTILHSLVLGQPPRFRILPYDDYRKDVAKEARDEVVKRGLIPILSHKYDDLVPVADSLRERLERDYAEVYAAMTGSGVINEATVIARVDGVLVRCRVDVLPPPGTGYTCDLKFTGRSAEPEEWSRKLRDDYLFQADLYPRCIHATRGDMPEFRFLVCETEPPYGVSMHAIAQDVAMIARRRVNVALRRWAHCLKVGSWPGYPAGVHYAEAPTWMITQDETIASRDNWLRDRGVYSEREAA